MNAARLKHLKNEATTCRMMIEAEGAKAYVLAISVSETGKSAELYAASQGLTVGQAETVLVLIAKAHADLMKVIDDAAGRQ